MNGPLTHTKHPTPHPSQRHVRQNISDGVNGGLSRGSRVWRSRSVDPHHCKQNFSPPQVPYKKIRLTQWGSLLSGLHMQDPTLSPPSREPKFFAACVCRLTSPPTDDDNPTQLGVIHQLLYKLDIKIGKVLQFSLTRHKNVSGSKPKNIAKSFWT